MKQFYCRRVKLLRKTCKNCIEASFCNRISTIRLNSTKFCVYSLNSTNPRGYPPTPGGGVHVFNDPPKKDQKTHFFRLRRAQLIIINTILVLNSKNTLFPLMHFRLINKHNRSLCLVQSKT